MNLTAADVGALPDSTVIPTVDQTYDGTSANAQSGVAIAGAGFVQPDSVTGFISDSLLSSNIARTNEVTLVKIRDWSVS